MAFTGMAQAKPLCRHFDVHFQTRKSKAGSIQGHIEILDRKFQPLDAAGKPVGNSFAVNDARLDKAQKDARDAALNPTQKAVFDAVANRELRDLKRILQLRRIPGTGRAPNGIYSFSKSCSPSFTCVKLPDKKVTLPVKKLIRVPSNDGKPKFKEVDNIVSSTSDLPRIKGPVITKKRIWFGLLRGKTTISKEYPDAPELDVTLRAVVNKKPYAVQYRLKVIASIDGWIGRCVANKQALPGPGNNSPPAHDKQARPTHDKSGSSAVPVAPKPKPVAVHTPPTSHAVPAKPQQVKTKKVCKRSGLVGAVNCVTIRIEQGQQPA
jgi:hypothetical protein